MSEATGWRWTRGIGAVLLLLPLTATPVAAVTGPGGADGHHLPAAESTVVDVDDAVASTTVLRGGGTTVTVTAKGFTSSAGWGLDLAAWGRPGAMHVTESGAVTDAGTGHVEVAHDDITAWYRTRSDGVEHGYTVAQPPSGAGPLVVRQAPTGGLLPIVDADGLAVTWLQLDGAEAGRYAGLVVTDATGAVLSAHLDTTPAGDVDVVVDDRGAIYPVVIDPVVTDRVELRATDGMAGDGFGFAVALDGDTAVVGAPWDTDGGVLGRAHVFERPTGSVRWRRTATLEAPPQAHPESGLFGWDVDLDGDTVVIGAPEPLHFHANGAAHVFERNAAGEWDRRASLAVANGGSAWFGASVALDGDRVVAGAPAFRFHQGTVAVFGRDVGGPDAWGNETQLHVDDLSLGSRFGESVDISGGTVVVGTRPPTDQAGRVYVFDHDTGGPGAWGLQERLVRDAPHHGFGRAVAIDGDRLAVGLPLTDGLADGDGDVDTGLVQLFGRANGSWERVGFLSPTAPEHGEQFGSSLALDGASLVVGTLPRDHEIHGGPVGHLGAAYVYDLTGGIGVLQAKLGRIPTQDVASSPDDLRPHDHFGAGVAVAGDTVLVGAYLKDYAGNDTGSVYVHERDLGGTAAWGERTIVTAAGHDVSDQYGYAVALDGDTLAVGAPLDGEVTHTEGVVFVYRRGAGGRWQLEDELRPLGAGRRARFGFSLALQGDTLVIGAPFEEVADVGLSAGATYVFRHDPQGGTWHQEARVLPDDSFRGAQFGWSVALSADTLVVGAPRHRSAAGPGGAAYVFARDLGGADAWGQAAAVPPVTPAFDSEFGWAVGIDGDTAVVTDRGQRAAYVFVPGDEGAGPWALQATLDPGPGAAGDWFGWSVDVDGPNVAIGSPSTSGGSAVHLFGADAGGSGAWDHVAELADGRSGFGEAVDLDTGTLLVGAPSAETAHVFQRDPDTGAWTSRDVVADSGPEGGRFGHAVAVDGASAVVGVPWKGQSARAAVGAAAVLELASDRPATPSVVVASGVSEAGVDDVIVAGEGPEGTTAHVRIDDRSPHDPPVTTSVPVGPNGYRTEPLSVSGLLDGQLTVSVTLVDAEGRTSFEGVATTWKDTEAPPPPEVIVSDPIQSSRVASVSISGMFAERGTTAIVHVGDEDPDTPLVRTVTPVGLAGFDASVDLSGLTDGHITVEVWLEDRVGNRSIAGIATTTLDTTAPPPPTVSVSDPIGADLQDAVAVSGRGEPRASVTIAIRDSARPAAQTSAATTVGADGTFSLTMDVTGLADGLLAVFARQSDVAGNSSESRFWTVTKDTVAPDAPTVAMTDPIDATNETGVDVTGSGEEGSTAQVGVDDTDPSTPPVTATVPVDGTGFTTTLDLSSLRGGTLTATVVLVDAAGNTSPAGTTTSTKADTDTDGDGIPDWQDTDDDGDGQTDNDEVTCGSDPLEAGSTSPDLDRDSSPDCVDDDDDGDGFTDAEEITENADPRDSDSVPTIAAGEAVTAGLEEVASDPAATPEAAGEIADALDDLNGKNGVAENGATDRLAAGETVAALTMLIKVLDHLAEAAAADPALDLATIEATLVAMARTAAVAEVEEARAADPDTDAVARADARIAAGDAAREAGELREAVTAYRLAVGAVTP